jgi:predicted RNase H-like HicB family nuclease
MPGCVTHGESLEEVRENLKEAIKGWLDAGNSTDPLAAEDQILELAL